MLRFLLGLREIYPTRHNSTYDPIFSQTSVSSASQCDGDVLYPVKDGLTPDSKIDIPGPSSDPDARTTSSTLI